MKKKKQNKREKDKYPTVLRILNKDIDLVFVDDLADKCDANGQARYRENKIILQKETKSIQRQKQDIDETIMHEILHYILNLLAYDELNKDEKFVTQISLALTQVLMDNDLRFIYKKKGEK